MLDPRSTKTLWNWHVVGLALLGTLIGTFAMARHVNGEDASSGEPTPSEEKISVLIIDGENPYHDWEKTTPVLVQILQSSGLFAVDRVTTPKKGEPMDDFAPKFADYDVLLSNYNGPAWPDATKQDFTDYVAQGGAFVAIHAADNAFPDWVAYNQMTGVGGWGDRNENSGPYVRWNPEQKRFVRDTSPGRGGSHGKRLPFLIELRDTEHAITRGLPAAFLQTEDELYGELRGPAQNLHILATAYSHPETGGTGKHEPILMTTRFGKGRIFHSVLGHDIKAMRGAAFQETLVRGTQWAATGNVTLEVVDPAHLSRQEATERDPERAFTSDQNVPDDQHQNKTIPDIDAAGWVELSDGKSLVGWTQRNGTATYKVVEGVIVGRTAKGSPNSFLCTNKDYADFELTFETMVDLQLNSGVQIRSQSKPDYKDGRVHGPQVEMESSPGEAGYLYSEATGRSWITKERPIKDAFKNGQWNRYVIRANGAHCQSWVNGIPLTDIMDEQSSKTGFIGLQVHSIKADTGPFEVKWRDIRIKELK